MKEKSISIIIPTLNSAVFIEKTLISLARVLDSLDFELIIVNDGSVDETIEKCLEFKDKHNYDITIINLIQNEGLKAATLVGLEHAKHRYAITYDDDMQFEDRDCLSLFEEIRKTEAFVVTGNYERETVNKWYDSSRAGGLKLFDFFFPRYVSCNYYTSFKIFDLQELSNNKISNVYYMWDIPPAKISSIFVERRNRIARQSNNNMAHSIKFVSHALLKISLKLLTYTLFALLILTVVFSLPLVISFIFIFLIIVNYILITLEKNKSKKLAKTVQIFK